MLNRRQRCFDILVCRFVGTRIFLIIFEEIDEAVDETTYLGWGNELRIEKLLVCIYDLMENQIYITICGNPVETDLVNKGWKYYFCILYSSLLACYLILQSQLWWPVFKPEIYRHNLECWVRDHKGLRG